MLNIRTRLWGVGISSKKNLSVVLEWERWKKELNVEHSSAKRRGKGKGRGKAVPAGHWMKGHPSNLHKTVTSHSQNTFSPPWPRDPACTRQESEVWWSFLPLPPGITFFVTAASSRISVVLAETRLLTITVLQRKDRSLHLAFISSCQGTDTFSTANHLLQAFELNTHEERNSTRNFLTAS